MKTFSRWMGLLLLCASLGAASAGEPWQDALAKMPLTAPATELDRTNCVPLLLNSFQSNSVVKALVFMPGATDELYFFKRAHAALTNANPTLLDAVAALTNQTRILATFEPPLLLLHTTEDVLDGFATVKNKSTAARLHERLVPGRVQLEDADWGKVRATMKGKLHIGLRPFENALDTYHFYRHNFTACGVTDWEMLETLALAGKTTFTVHWLTAKFQPDRREGVTPTLGAFPSH
ncbi:MAG TPA: hypothetical protein VFY06_08000 [Verrucomicrobiae bacterium]|nr:hypothetical protein [Verrucomicrobiae bacterium]